MKRYTQEWAQAALIRAIKTVAQTALGMLTVGAAVTEIDWMHVASVAVVAGIYSILTSLAGLPEVESMKNDADDVKEGDEEDVLGDY